jgi:hypothetical protein
LLLAAGVVACVSIAFVVGGEVNRRSSLVGGRSPSEPARDIAASAEARDARPADEPDAPDAEARDAQGNETELRAAEEREAREEDGEIEAAAERPPPRARDGRPRHERWTYPAAPRRPASASPLPMDEDATLPASEPSN